MDINPTTFKELFQGQAFQRGIRMKRESSPLNVKYVMFSQPINTPRDEVAPGSDIVGKDLQYRCFGHCMVLISSVDESRSGPLPKKPLVYKLKNFCVFVCVPACIQAGLVTAHGPLWEEYRRMYL